MRSMLIAIAASFVAFGAQAQQASDPDIVVEGTRIEQVAREFARGISATPSRSDQLGRFGDRVCPGVLGLNQRQGQFIADRIGQRAHEVGLEVGAPGCRANVLVLVTRDPSGLAGAIAEEQRYLMADYGRQENLDTRGSEALDRFIHEDRAVRWWHVAQTVSRDGQVLRNVQSQRWGGSNQSAHLNVEAVRANPLTASRGSVSTRQEFRNVVVIVDAARASAVRLDGLADYIAMISLAQIEPDADTHTFSSVLNLFAGGGDTTTTAMTEWDHAYLLALYEVDPHATSTHRQTNSIGRRMGRTLTRVE